MPVHSDLILAVVSVESSGFRPDSGSFLFAQPKAASAAAHKTHKQQAGQATPTSFALDNIHVTRSADAAAPLPYATQAKTVC